MPVLGRRRRSPKVAAAIRGCRRAGASSPAERTSRSLPKWVRDSAAERSAGFSPLHGATRQCWPVFRGCSEDVGREVKRRERRAPHPVVQASTGGDGAVELLGSRAPCGRSFRAAGCRPLRQARMRDATAAVGAMQASPATRRPGFPAGRSIRCPCHRAARRCGHPRAGGPPRHARTRASSSLGRRVGSRRIGKVSQ